MRKFVPVLLAVLALGSFTWIEGQRTSAQKNGRDTVQRGQLKKLLARVGVEVPERDTRSNKPQTYRELKIRWNEPAKKTNELQPADPEAQAQSSAGQAQTPAGQTQTEQTQTPSASVIEDTKRSGALPRQRSLELSPTHIFIAAVDATNKLRWWSIVPDPRLVRAETPTPTGELRREDEPGREGEPNKGELRRHDYYMSNVTLVVAFPDDPEIANLRFYHPVWNGTDFDLKPLTNVPTR